MLNNPFLFKWDPSLTIKNSNYGKKAEENPVAIFWEPKDLTQEAGDHIPFWGSESLIEAQEESTQPQFYITTGKPRSVIAGLIYDDTQMAYYYIFPAKEEEKDLGTEYIKHLINFNYDLLKPIEIKLKEIGGEYIGTIDDLKLHAWGEDLDVVRRELNENITRLFEKLISMDDNNLGKYPKKWKEILNTYVTKTTLE